MNLACSQTQSNYLEYPIVCYANLVDDARGDPSTLSGRETTGEDWMSNKQSVGKIIREQRKSIPLTLNQLADMSGVSPSHLARIEKGQRVPSPHTLQKVAKPLGFDLNELLILTGYLSLEPSMLHEEERKKLRAELTTLLDRVATDGKRIKEIIDRLLMTSQP